MKKELGLQTRIEDRMDNAGEVFFKTDFVNNGWEFKDRIGYIHRLTNREFQVLELLCKYGYNGEKIVARL